jgi:tRNA (cytidine/uridine-2'-O-)-methyltransferase
MTDHQAWTPRRRVRLGVLSHEDLLSPQSSQAPRYDQEPARKACVIPLMIFRGRVRTHRSIRGIDPNHGGISKQPPLMAPSMAQAHSNRPKFEIILLQPEIPNNTGNIGRTAAATGCRLHVVHPIGFDMDEKALRRAGLDYWKHVDCLEHDSWPACEAAISTPPWLLTARRGRPVWDADLQHGDRLIFGRESNGVGPEFTDAFEAEHGADRILSLPMVDAPGIRSLNLATAVAVVVYEGLRQLEKRDG